MNKKRLILMGLILIVSAGIIVLLVQYYNYISYRKALGNSNFLNWCISVSVANIDIAAVSSGYGHQNVKIQLTNEEKIRLVNVLSVMTTDDIRLSNVYDVNENKSGKSGNRLYVRCTDGIEYVFYFSDMSMEALVSTTIENHDEFKDRSYLYVKNQVLNSFIKSIWYISKQKELGTKTKYFQAI